jgi:hypothetical protein
MADGAVSSIANIKAVASTSRKSNPKATQTWDSGAMEEWLHLLQGFEIHNARGKGACIDMILPLDKAKVRNQPLAFHFKDIKF